MPASGSMHGNFMNASMLSQVHVCGDYRIIRSRGAVVPFNTDKLSKAMMKLFLGVNVRETVSLASSNAGGGTSAGDAHSGASTANGAPAGGGDGDSDSDGDGDGDSDGPRSRLPRQFRSSRITRRVRPSNTLGRTNTPRIPTTVHKAPLFLVVVGIVVGAVLILGLNGQQSLAEKLLSSLNAIAALASALPRLK
jgi:hypothetical protein